ncbi:MAG: DUF2510 domain-containing protein [Aquihabitans sp.]
MRSSNASSAAGSRLSHAGRTWFASRRRHEGRRHREAGHEPHHHGRDRRAQFQLAGWHPDPQNPQQLRYWDGSTWANDTRPF